MRYFLSVFLKGIWIGGTLTIPGVSGGSMALILGIYEKLIFSLNALFSRNTKKKECVGFLLVFFVGAVVGVIALSRIVVWLLQNYSEIITFFFAGAVAGGIPTLWREAKIIFLRWYHILYLFCGIAIVISLSSLPANVFSITEGSWLFGSFMQIVAGFIAAVALVLPGISVSHMLYVLGIYKELMEALSRFQFLHLLPIAIGGIVGTILTTKVVGVLIESYKAPTYMLILGFVLGSVAELLATVEISSITLLCPLLFGLGFIGMFLLFKKSSAGA